MARPAILEVETNPILREFLTFLPEASKESDRGLVLICASYIDELLRRVLLAFIVDEKKHGDLIDEGPLSTFSSRIKACLALGLIQQSEADDCDRVRRIRNRFSHEVTVSFADQQIRDLRRNLIMRIQEEQSARGMFFTGAVGLILRLVLRPATVNHRRLVASDWD